MNGANIRLASTGSKNQSRSGMGENGKTVTGLLTVVELKELDGKSKFDFPVETMISI